MQISIPTDADGFLSQECPACSRRFRVRFGEGSVQPIAYCPYCGHQGMNCWWTEEQAEYMAAVASGEVVAPELRKMARRFNQQAGGGLFKMKMTVKTSPPPSAPVEPVEVLPVAQFACCNERIKHDGRESTLHCVICGERSPVGARG